MPASRGKRKAEDPSKTGLSRFVSAGAKPTDTKPVQKAATPAPNNWETIPDDDEDILEVQDIAPAGSVHSVPEKKTRKERLAEKAKKETKNESKTEAKVENFRVVNGRRRRERVKIYLNQELLDRLYGNPIERLHKKDTYESSESVMAESLPKLPKMTKDKLSHLTFDPVWCKNNVTIPSVFPQSQRFYDNENRYRKMEQVMIQRFRQITPNTEQRATTRAMQTKVSRAFEALLDTPLARSGTLPILYYAEVGSFAKRTYMFPNLTSDCAVIMKVRPTREAVKRLTEHFLIQYNRLNAVQLYRYDEVRKENVYLSDDQTTTPLEVQFNEEGGFEINSEEANVRVMIGCQKHKMSMGIDSNLHISKQSLAAANAALDHVKWFNEKVTNNKVRILIVLLKDLCLRFESIRLCLNPRLIELLVYYVFNDGPAKYDSMEYLVEQESQIKQDDEDKDIEMNEKVELSLGEGMIRVLQLLSTGFLTPASSGLVDPLNGEINQIDPENQLPNGANISHHRVHKQIEMHLLENMMATCQTLFRIVLAGGIEKIFDPAMASSLERQETVVSDVLITPGKKIYA